jgi:hypothetical protein
MSISPSAYHEGPSVGRISLGQYIPRFALCVVFVKRVVVLEGTFVLSEYFDVCAHSALGNLSSLDVDKKKSGTNFHCPAISWNTEI